MILFTRKIRSTQDRDIWDKIGYDAHVTSWRKGAGVGQTVRFGISLDEKLLQNFDQLIEQKSYMNRSEALRDLIRASLSRISAERRIRRLSVR